MDDVAHPFVHLHVHSDFSLLDGAAQIPMLVRRAQELNMLHLALTDHGNLFGAMAFYKECRKAGINPLLGCEFYIASQSRFSKEKDSLGRRHYHLTILAKNKQGYRNLMYLSSMAYLEGFYYKPRIDEELLFSRKEGLICLSGCVASPSSQLIIEGKLDEAKKLIQRYQEAFGDDYYLELQNHGLSEQIIVNQALMKFSQELGIPLVATNDTHYIHQSDAKAQDVLICIGTGKKRDDPKRLVFENSEFYLKTFDQMKTFWKELPEEAFAQTLKIAEKCQLDIELPGPLLPYFTPPQPFESREDYLRHLALAGLKTRYEDLSDFLFQRLDYELNLINQMGFAGYFLIVWDFIQYARQKDIPVGPGRGSGAGSLVAYSLRITDIDPIAFNLLFERFLNPERISMPDFDIDFCYERRSEVIDYVSAKYGTDHVAQIITFGTLKAKAVVKDVARVLDIPFAESNELTKIIPEGPKVSLKEALEDEAFDSYRQRGGRYRDLLDISLVLEGTHRHVSTHAAGIVISQDPLMQYVPLYKDSQSNAVSTQYSMEFLEECGLVKMDFLGLRTLTILKESEDLIHLREPSFSLSSIPLDDQATFALLSEGRSASVFQFESSGMQNILREAKPHTLEDLIALNALYRPGPMQFIAQYIESKNHPQRIKYPHPDLEEILKPTYGVIVYQEQVMQVAETIAGFSLAKADILRRAMGKKKEDEMNRLEKDFIEGALKKGYPSSLASEIFEILTPFAGYGFNKSHAAAYSFLAYQTAYLKANFPAEFMAANLSNEIHDTNKISYYINEIKEIGLQLIPPHINMSEKDFTVRNNAIIYGLAAIKNLGQGLIQLILDERHRGGNFSTFTDFLARVDLRKFNKKFFESAIGAGLFDGLAPSRATLLAQYEQAVDLFAAYQEQKRRGQHGLFENSLSELRFDFIPKEELPLMELLEKELELLGYYASGHPMEEYRDLWEKYEPPDLSSMENLNSFVDREVNLIAMVSFFRAITTRKGDTMAFLHIQDFRGSLEAIVFSRIYERVSPLLQRGSVLLFSGRLSQERGETKLIVDSVFPPKEKPPVSGSSRSLRKNPVRPETSSSTPEKKLNPVLSEDSCTLHVRLEPIQELEPLLEDLKKVFYNAAMYRGGLRVRQVYLYWPQDQTWMQFLLDSGLNGLCGNEETLEHLKKQKYIKKVWCSS